MDAIRVVSFGLVKIRHFFCNKPAAEIPGEDILFVIVSKSKILINPVHGFFCQNAGILRCQLLVFFQCFLSEIGVSVYGSAVMALFCYEPQCQKCCQHKQPDPDKPAG